MTVPSAFYRPLVAASGNVAGRPGRSQLAAANKRFAELLIEPDVMTWWAYTKAAAPVGGIVDHLKWVKSPEVVVDKVVDWWTDLQNLGRSAI